jgi:hypothetical protein
MTVGQRMAIALGITVKQLHEHVFQQHQPKQEHLLQYLSLQMITVYSWYTYISYIT